MNSSDIPETVSTNKDAAVGEDVVVVPNPEQASKEQDGVWWPWQGFTAGVKVHDASSVSNNNICLNDHQLKQWADDIGLNNPNPEQPLLRQIVEKTIQNVLFKELIPEFLKGFYEGFKEELSGIPVPATASSSEASLHREISAEGSSSNIQVVEKVESRQQSAHAAIKTESGLPETEIKQSGESGEEKVELRQQSIHAVIKTDCGHPETEIKQSGESGEEKVALGQCSADAVIKSESGHPETEVKQSGESGEEKVAQRQQSGRKRKFDGSVQESPSCSTSITTPIRTRSQGRCGMTPEVQEKESSNENSRGNKKKK